MKSRSVRTLHLSLGLGAVAALASCSASLVPTPASPEPEPTTTQTPIDPSSSPEPEPEPQPSTSAPIDVRNPYEAGASPDWSIELPAEPDTVVYDRQSGTVVAVVDDELVAFEVTNSGRTLERWSYPLDAPVMSLDAANGRIYVSIGNETPEDFLILHAARGTEEFSWVQSNPLDRDAPLVVGMYDDGIGVVKLDRDSVVAALLDNNGDVVDSSRVFYGEADLAQFVPEHDLVPIESDGHLTTYAVFPELETVTGTNCYSLTDGLVCTEPYVSETVDGPDGSGDFLLRVGVVADAMEDDAAGADDTAGTDDTAGADGADNAVDAETPASDEEPASERDEHEHSDEIDRAEPDITDDPTGSYEPGGVAAIIEYDRSANPVRHTVVTANTAAVKYDLRAFNDDTSVRELARALASEVDNDVVVKAILNDGDWIESTDWSDPSARPFAFGAPFARSGETVINLVSGQTLVDGDSAVLRGSGGSDSMFFSWDGETLTYLRPLG